MRGNLDTFYTKKVGTGVGVCAGPTRRGNGTNHPVPRRHRAPNQTCKNPMVELADGEYQRRKESGITQPGITHVERLFNLKPGQLWHYRANTYSRKKI